MIRTSRLCAFVVTVLSCFTASADEREHSCAPKLFQEAAPVVKNPKLAAQTYEICFSEIAIVYSGLARVPLWSAEHLTAGALEAARGLARLRSNAFHEEERLPPNARAELSDYRRSGFDRGHMAPNGDMSTPEAQAESFSLANMIPQDPCNNEVLWEGIESAVRDLARSEGEVFIVTGPAFLSAELDSLKGRVLVPTHLYKAVYVPSRRAAAAYFAPNDDSQSFDTISIAELETRIGIDVFPGVDVAIKRTAMPLPTPTPHFGCRVRSAEARRRSAEGGR